MPACSVTGMHYAPDCNDKFVSLAMPGAKMPQLDFSSKLSNTSSGDDLHGIEVSSRRTSSEDAGWSCESCGPDCGRVGNSRRADERSASIMLSRMLSS